MLKIYTAAVTRKDMRTLQADGATWEELTTRLRSQGKDYLLDLVINSLPPQFSRLEIIRITVQEKFYKQILEVAGLSG